MFVDSDHAGHKVSCRSRSAFLIYVNPRLVQWLSKKQFTVETSVFCTEFATMTQGIDALRALRYKLWEDGYINIQSLIYLWGQYVSAT